MYINLKKYWFRNTNSALLTNAEGKLNNNEQQKLFEFVPT